MTDLEKAAVSGKGPEATKRKARSKVQPKGSKTSSLAHKSGANVKALKPVSAKPLRHGFMGAFLAPDGAIVVEHVTNGFRMSKGQLAETVGLSREALYKESRMNAVKTQSRILEMLEILNRVSAWAGGKEQAMAWYRAEPIPALGDRTAESLVKSGDAATVRDYLDMIATGGFA